MGGSASEQIDYRPATVTGVLREHLLRGQSRDECRLRKQNQAIRLVADIAQRRGLCDDEGAVLLSAIRADG